MTRFAPLAASLVLLLAAGGAQAADLQRGKQLHDANCIRCHASIMGGNGTAIYTRPDRRIDSLPALEKQVRRCKNSLGISWPDDQVQDVVAYLNKNFYKFGQQASGK